MRSSMNPLVKLQLKKAFGEDYAKQLENEQFQNFVSMVEKAYERNTQEIALIEDILQTQAKELEEQNRALLEQKLLFENVQNSIGDAVFYKDLHHRYLGCNAIFSQFFGLKEKDIVGKTDFDFMDYHDALQAQKINNQVMQEKKVLQYCYKIVKNKKEYIFLITKSPLINPLGEIFGVVAVAKEITHEIEIQKEIEQKNRLLIQSEKLALMGEMVGAIAHQWRQPLYHISLLAQRAYLEKECSYFDEIVQTTQTMSQTIDDFQNFLKPVTKIEEFNFEDLVDSIVKLLQKDLEQNSIKVSFVGCNKKIKHYKSELFHILLNLLVNAVDVHKAKCVASAYIKISLTQKQNSYEIVVYDNAEPIASKNLQKIFLPHFSTKKGGSGLGLYIARLVVTLRLGGALKVKNSSNGKSFVLEIPLSPPPPLLKEAIL